MVHVAVGVVINDDKVLVAKRHQSQHQGGLWEFPGGKIESTETVEDALTRELQEELSITPQKVSRLIDITHEYSDKRVTLEVFLVTRYSGAVNHNEGQEVRWVTLEELTNYEFPEANIAIIDKLKSRAALV